MQTSVELFKKVLSDEAMNDIDTTALKQLIQEAIQASNDDLILQYLLLSPTVETNSIGFLVGNYAVWREICIREVINRLKQPLNTEITKALYSFLSKYGNDYTLLTEAYNTLIKAESPLVFELLTNHVKQGGTRSNGDKWSAAVSFLSRKNRKEAILAIADGILARNTYSDRTADISMAVMAIIDLDSPDTDIALQMLIAAPNERVRRQVVHVLKDKCEIRTLPYLKQRLGGFFKKVEPDIGIRKDIEYTVKKIKEKMNKAT